MKNLLTDIQAALTQLQPLGVVKVVSGRPALTDIVRKLVPEGVHFNDSADGGFVGAVVITDQKFIPAAVFDAMAVVIVRYDDRGPADLTVDGIRAAYRRLRIVRGGQLRA